MPDERISRGIGPVRRTVEAGAIVSNPSIEGETQPHEPKPRRPRITYIGTLRHQVPGLAGSEPQPIRFTKWTNPHDEDVYERRVKCGSEWQSLDLGPIRSNEVALIVLGNPLPSPSPRSPEPEYVVEIGLLDSNGSVTVMMEYGPGESYPVPAKNVDKYRVRIVGVPGRYYVFVIPG